MLKIALAIALYVLVTVVVVALGVRVLLALPATYFRDGRTAGRAGGLARLARNILGLLLIVIGAVMSLPGMPGQGILTILVGLTMVEFPGRRRMELFLIRQPGVLSTLNRVRTRFRREPFLPGPARPGPEDRG